jgi:SET domain-containing protein
MSAHMPASQPTKMQVPCERYSTIPNSYFNIEDGPKGRGLFASLNIPPRTLIHIAPCLRVDQGEYQSHMKHTILEHYLFNDSGGRKLLALGYGSLFNHSRTPNIDYRVDSTNLEIRYNVGHQPILAGEELCIFYGVNLWFDDAEGSVESEPASEDEMMDGMASFLCRIELNEHAD